MQYLHEKLRVSLLPRDRRGNTAAEVAASLDSSMQTPEWPTIVAYLEQAQAAEELERRRRMSLAVIRVLRKPLGNELSRKVINDHLNHANENSIFARAGSRNEPAVKPLL